MNRKLIVLLVVLAVLVGLSYYFGPTLAAWFGKARAKTDSIPGGSRAQHSSSATAEQKQRRVLYWVDPMHPAYKSDRPGIAPDCGMQLVPVYADEAEQMAKAPAGTVRITPERQQLIGVKLGRAEVRPVRKTIRAVARIANDETRIVHVHSKVDGWIEEIFVNSVGAPVEKGDPLFTLYSPELVSAQQEYLIALRARRQLAESPVPGIARSTESLYQAARRRLELWDVSPDQIRKLEESGESQQTVTFYSPHHGFVLEKKAFEHLRVTQDTDLYLIADLSTVWAIADVYEYEASMVQPGQKATMTLAYLPGQSFAGKVSYIYPQLDPQTRTLRVRLDIANANLRLRPEMFATVEIEVDLGKQLVVPVEAVLDSGNKQYAFVTRGDGYFEPREIKLGPRSDGYYVVESGLKPGEQVVTSANFLIDSESRLKAATAQMQGEHRH